MKKTQSGPRGDLCLMQCCSVELSALMEMFCIEMSHMAVTGHMGPSST